MRPLRHPWRARGSLALAAAALATACADDDVTLTGLTVDPATATLEVGATRAFHARARYSDGHTADLTTGAAWTTSNAAIATVGAADGTARGVGPGAVTLTAAVGSRSAQAMLTVAPARVLTITITPANPVDLPIGMTRAFRVTGTHVDGTTIDLTEDAHLAWSTSMPAVATVSAVAGMRGVATGLAEGATDIGAVYDDRVNPAVTAAGVALHVTRSPLVSLALEPVGGTVPRGYTLQFRLVGTYADAHVEDLTGDARTAWTSATPAVATVSNETGSRGLVTGVGAGDVEIRAAFAALDAATSLRVTDATLSAVAVTPPTATVTRGGSIRLRATGVFSDMTTMDLSDVATWETADAARATVSNTRSTAGVVTVPAAAATGPVVITARRGSVSSTATITVNTAVTLQRLDVAVDQALIPVGLTARARAYGTYGDGVTTFSRDVTEQVAWSTTGAAMISNAAGEHGLITANLAGAASVGATLDGVVAAAVPITVTGCQLNALRVAEGASLSMPRGTARWLTARALYNTAATGCESLGSAWYDVTNQSQTVWTSSNTAVLTVGNVAGSRGLVRAAGAPAAPAAADVQVRFGTLMATARVAVLDACVRSVAVTAASNSLPAGIEVPLRAVAAMSDGTSRDVTAGVAWVSSSAAVASVETATGVLHTNAPGAATVTAQVAVAARCAAATGGSLALTVNTATIAGVAVDPAARSLARGERAQLRAIGTFSDARQFDLTTVAAWSSSNAAIATVSDGLVQANSLADGNAIVTAAFGARDAFSTVTVSGARLQRVTVGVAPAYACGTNAAGAYPAGAHVPLVATGFFSDMTSRALGGVAWVGDDASISVGRDGVVAVLGPGTGRVRAVAGSVQSDPFTVAGAEALLTGIQVSPPSGWSMPLGSDQQFRAAGVFQGFAGSCPIGESVAWTATATAPANLAITLDGYARAGTGGPGAASVRAAMGTVSAVSAGTVRGACVNGIMVEPATASTAVGVRVDVAAFLTYSDGSRARVAAAWSTGTPAVARASGDLDLFGRPIGAVSPLSAGTTTVVARVAPPEGAACAGLGPTFTGTAALTVTGERLASITVDCTVDPDVARCNFGDAARPAYPAGLPVQCRAYGHGTAGAQWDFTASADWSSSDPGVLQVGDVTGSKGLARTVAAGAAVVVARYGAVSGARTVDVNAAALRAIAVTPGSVNLPAGFTQRFAAEGTFALPGSTRQCPVTAWATWSTSDPAVVAIGNAGDYRAMAWMLAPRTAAVTVGASFLGQSGSATVTVNSATLAAITVVPTTARAAVGQAVGFSAAGRYSDGSARDVTSVARWSTGDSRIAVVANALGVFGVARGVAEGATVVRAEIGALVSEAALTVTSACVRRLVLGSTDGATLRPSGVPVTFVARANWSDGTTGDVTDGLQWATSDEGICPVPDAVDGTFTSITRAPGGASVAATMPGCDGPITARVAVTVSAATLRAIEVRGPNGSSAIPLGVTAPFRAFGSYSDATVFDLTAAVQGWALGNESVADLAGGGAVVGRALGTSTLTATQGAVSGATTVTVTQAALSSIRVAALDLTESCRDASDPAAYVTVGARAPVSSVGRLRAWGTYSDQTVRDLTDDVLWTAVDPAVAVVFNVPTQRGVVFHRAAGTTLLRASLITGPAASLSDSVAVEVRAGTLAGLAINPNQARPLATALGNRPQLALVGDYGAAGRYCVGANAAWSTADPAVATVRQGLLTTLTTGGTAVTATIGTVSDSLNVVVGSPTLTFVEVTPRALSVARWSTSRMRALAHYSDGTVDDVSANPSTLWSSTVLSGTGVLLVDPGTLERGLIWAYAPGQARVDACIGTRCASAAPDRSGVVTVTP